ncbi:Hypothetical protein PHPALM_11851 [Phytophthora palmivora]|uniref:Uncharacterized protein n=1 Tax=Phytophthora palmivora TaxID=4796 RepID=A0A2P4Y166_9STRA|nr:Hypothetical protein PHPALM_11851 [Phytophthora palmivora]
MAPRSTAARLFIDNPDVPEPKILGCSVSSQLHMCHLLHFLAFCFVNAMNFHSIATPNHLLTCLSRDCPHDLHRHMHLSPLHCF